ncbi:MAG: hypothetical protein EOO56_27640, partial [Hymenobacter sp.]
MGSLLAARPARAQSGEGLYAAPGHLITFPHRLPPPPPRPDAIVSPILPRFWHDEANGRTRASDFYRFMSQYLKYPKPAIDAGMVGRIYVRAAHERQQRGLDEIILCDAAGQVAEAGAAAIFWLTGN